MCFVRGCALIGSLAIWAYSLTGLPFVIKIFGVNRIEPLEPIIQECRSTWQDRYVMSSGPQDPVGRELWVIMSTKGTTSA